uniref:NAC domain-containing protein n=1 Tax=Elaeophora elaphi TaxID=1147741 RepID=A0A0R3RRR4_9BILA
MGDSSCSISFCFSSRCIRYDFSYKLGALSYRAGYKVSFNQLESINFQGYYVNFKLSQPAEQEYCNRESVADGKRVVVPCNDFDITLGQYKTTLIHVIRLNSDESAMWIFHLLDADHQFFKPLIRRAVIINGSSSSNHTASDAISNSSLPTLAVDSSNSSLPTLAVDPSNSSLPTLAVNPATISLFPGHDDAHNFIEPKCSPPQSLHTAQHGNINDETTPIAYNATANSSALSASFTSYNIEQSQQPVIYGGENSWQSEIFLAPEELNTCPTVPQTVPVESTVTSSEACVFESTDGIVNDCGLQIPECYNDNGGNFLSSVVIFSNLCSYHSASMKSTAEKKEPKVDNDPSIINSVYVMPDEEQLDSEYVPQKSDSQYILSDLDMLFQ